MRLALMCALAALILGGGGSDAQAACDSASYTVVAPGGSISAAIAAEVAGGATEVSICLEGLAVPVSGFCSDGTFYDHIDVNGIDLHIIPDPDQPDICIENPPGGTLSLPGMSCEGPLRLHQGCGWTSTIRIRNSPTGSSIGGFSRISNTRGDCAIDVYDSQLTIHGRSSTAPMIYSSEGLAFRVWATSPSPGDPHVEVYGASIEESVVGLVLRGDASFAGNDVHIQGHSVLGVDAMDQSSLLLVDSSLEDNDAVAWFCDDAEGIVENVGIVNNSAAALATKEHGIWLVDRATLDAFNVLAHTNDFSESDVGFVFLQDDSELSLASSTFVDNEASFEVQWIDDTRVDIVDTIFHDSTASSHTPSTDPLYCNTTVASTADHVNGYGYLHGDGIGPFIGGVTVWNTAGWPCFLTNNTAVPPMFALGTYNKYYLQQSTPASPMIDAGSDYADVIYDFDLGDWTTDPSAPPGPDPVLDSDMVDLGYHQLPAP